MAALVNSRRDARRKLVRRGKLRRRLVLPAVGLLLLALGASQAVSSSTVDVTSAVALRVSDSPDRSEPTPLDGATVSGEQYVFVPKVVGMRAVLFYEGQPSESSKIASEGAYPYDLAGGTNEEANPVDVSDLGSGQITLTAVAYFWDGRSHKVSASFVVAEPHNPTPTASPTPTATPTPTASPTPTATPTPTASPTPTATPTPTASPTPTATPTPTPTPTPTTKPTSDPTQAPPPESPPAGYPNEDTTGVPAGTNLKAVGGTTVTEDGSVLDGLDMRGCLTIAADNVTVRNSRIRCAAGSGAVIKVASGSQGALIENVEIDGQGASSNGVGSGGYTLTHVNIHSTADGVRAGSNSVIEHSYIHHLSRIDGSHNDGIQSVGGTNITIRYNNIQAFNSTTNDPMNAAYIFAPDLSPLTNVQVYGNLMNGGNYTLFGANATNAVIRDNAFGRDFRYGPVRIDGTIDFDDSNVWHDDGTPVR